MNKIIIIFGATILVVVQIFQNGFPIDLSVFTSWISNFVIKKIIQLGDYSVSTDSNRKNDVISGKSRAQTLHSAHAHNY